MNSYPKSILLIGNFLSGSVGTRAVGEDLGEFLVERGWQVILTSRHTNKFLRLVDMLNTTYTLRNTYHVANVDVFSGAAFYWAALVCRLLSAIHKPFNLTLRGGRLPDFMKRHPVRIRRLLASATHVNTPSKYLQLSLKPYRADIQWLPNGIDVANYQTCQRALNSHRLVWLRAFHEIYHPQMAIEALAILNSTGHDYSLIMIGPDKGDGSYQACIDLAKEKGISQKIHFTGPVDKQTVPSWLIKGDIFLNTTRYESFGVSVLEAAACGLPIVTTNVGELPYLWEHEQDALLVPPDDASAMAAAVCRLLTEPGLAEKLSQNARNKAQSFDWSLILPQWELLFQNLSVNLRE